MNFQPSEVTLEVARAEREFAAREIRPYVMEWDEQQHFPLEVLQSLGKLGMMGVLVPEQYGGAGLGYFEYNAVIQEIAKVCGSIGLSVAAHNSLCTNHILSFGSEEQKKQWLPKLATAEWIGAWGLTEPNTGSDAGNMKTTAVKDGDHWILNGTNNSITHGISADLFVIMARTGEPRTKDNATAFIVPKGTDGLRGGKKENKLGMRASETAEVILDNVRIPDENRIGDVGASATSMSSLSASAGWIISSPTRSTISGRLSSSRASRKRSWASYAAMRTSPTMRNTAASPSWA